MQPGTQPWNATPLFGAKDLEFLKSCGISPETAERQIAFLRQGVRFPDPVRACRLGDGIRSVSQQAADHWQERFASLVPGFRMGKFVPASGAASRMFKTILADRHKGGSDQDAFFRNLPAFAFYEDLEAYAASQGRTVGEMAPGAVVDALSECRPEFDFKGNIIRENALCMTDLPKGMLKFHRYPDGARTAFEEHMVDAAAYLCREDGTCHLHFTVPRRYRNVVADLVKDVGARHEKALGCRFRVHLSEQAAATDTLAVDDNGEPFRTPEGTLFLRPGGHGALLQNLMETDADAVFIQNIDNIAPDRLKAISFHWKRILGGIFLSLLTGIREQQQALAQDPSSVFRAKAWITEHLPELKEAVSEDATAEEIQRVLDRPLRVCGVIANTGEPGGGPFWVRGKDGKVGLRILESVEIPPTPAAQNMLQNAIFFNPVDMICGLTRRDGSRFDLHQYVDPEAYLVTEKSLDGKPLTALEHPGLWNGAMADWITVFVAVPGEMFHPVKTIYDLLRQNHRQDWKKEDV